VDGDDLLGRKHPEPDREAPIVASGTDQPWGVGFLTWAIDVGAVERALEYGPRAVMLSFGDPSPYVEVIRQAATVLIIQVTDLEEARQAVDLGADVIVAQGTEAGGHGARRGRSTLPFVPVVVDLAAAGVSFEIATLEGVTGVGNLLAQIKGDRLLFGSLAPFFYFESAALKLKESVLTGAQLTAVSEGNARKLLTAH
jgi:hypothetical protein